METLEYIGRYRVVRRLGTGGMGEVFLAHDDDMGRPVAIKRLVPRGTDAEQQRKRFRREASSMARLVHPGIVSVHDVITDGDAEYIVMEYVDGTTLREHVASQGHPSLRDVLRMGRQIAEAMAMAHASGIIHRDLKSENVLLDRVGNVKIIDFGIAKVIGAQTLTEEGRILGTYKAMSPEQVLGKEVNEASDLFSFGILLYEAIAGELPFTGSGIAQIVEAITRHEQPRLCMRVAGVPEELSDLIDRLLHKHPLLRPRGFPEVAASLQAIEAGLGDEATTFVAHAAALAPTLDGQSTEESGLLPALPDAAVSRALGGMTSRQLAAGQSEVADAARAGARRWRGTILGGTAALIMLGAYAAWPGSDAPTRDALPAGPRYVAVLPPEIANDCAHDSVLLTRTIHHGAEQALLSLAGVHVIAEAEREPLPADVSRAQLASALAADELLTSQLDCYPDRILIGIQRIRADGSLLRQNAPFELDVSDLGPSSVFLRQQVHELYSELELREDVAAQEDARPEDIERFRRLRQDYWRGQPRNALAGMLDELAHITASSPRFLDAYVFAAELWMHRYHHERDPEFLERAWALIQPARELAPSSRHVLMRVFTVALERGDMAACASALDALDALDPGSGITLYMHALVKEHGDDTPGARALLQKAAQRHPSWRILFHLARLDLRMGDVQAARRHLDEVFARSPGNQVALQLEKLIETTTRSDGVVSPLDPTLDHSYSELINQAAALMNVQRYSEAIPFLEQARAKRPEGWEALFNLAEVLKLVGDAARATHAFQQVLTLVPATEERALLLAVRAQALAHVGRFEDAVGVMARALARNQDADTCYAAAVVHALAENTPTAVTWAERALALGYAAQWFHYPWFERVRAESPRLRALPAGGAAPPERD